MSPIEDNIVNPQPSDTPKTLYKYRHFDDKEYHIRLVAHKELWFTSANEFNDPFDSSLPYRFDDDPPGIQMKWILHATEQFFPRYPKNLIIAKAQKRYKEINSDPEYFRKFSLKEIEKNFKRFGICSLTPKPNNLLMWAHYANNHEGFCVGIDTSKIYKLQRTLATQHELLELLKIKYSKKMPEINFYNSMLSEQKIWAGDMLNLLSSKSTHWEYENEYRLIYYDNVNISLNIGHDAMHEIILGCKISDYNKDKILTIVSDLNDNIPVYQSITSHVNYELEFERLV